MYALATALILGAVAPANRLVAQRVPAGAVQPSAAIHWQNVPLREALARLQKLFDVAVFLDRRVDPTLRVKLDIEASSVDDVLQPIAAAHGLGVGRIGSLAYLGPQKVAEQVHAVAAARAGEVARLAPSQRSSLSRKGRLMWLRLTEPRGLVTSLVEQHGWRVANPQLIPHDLWAAATLPELTLAEQLTALLVGFDLTFELQPRSRTIAVVPLKLPMTTTVRTDDSQPQPRPPRPTPPPANTRQVYSLRVADKPVGAVLNELARRLNWKIDIDRAAIEAAGRSLEERVSFTVDNAEQDELLEALLKPAGLAFERDDENIKVVPR